ncbi:MAG: DUF5711 family protein [Acutalibacteraceae bacterium]
MDNKSSKNNKKTETKKSGKLKIFKSTALVIAFAVLIIVVVLSVSNEIPVTGFFGISDDSSSETESGNSGFPLSFSSALRNVAVTDNAMYALTKNSVVYFDLSGRKREEIVLNYSDPAIKTSSRFALVYDRQGSRYSLFSGKKNIFSQKNNDDFQIYSAYVSDNGSFVLVSSSDKAASTLTYYNKKGKIIYQWNCANEYIVSAAALKNSKSLACASISSVSGQIMSHIYYFDINNSANNRDYSFNDTSAIDCFFISGKKLAVVCNNRRIIIDCSSERVSPVQAKFPSALYKRSSDSKGNTAVIMRKNDSYNEFTVQVYDSDNNIIVESEINNVVKDIVCSERKVYALTDSGVIRADDENREVFSVSSSYESLVIGRNKIFCYSTSMICRN